jgi:hypothetical protein
MNTAYINHKNPRSGDKHVWSPNMTNLWDTGPVAALKERQYFAQLGEAEWGCCASFTA